ncbi:fatty acid desaturase, partial [Mycolicibacterium sp. CBMA 361]
WFHIFSGNLSFQIEHHLFPDIPAHRYAEISPEVKALCEKYELPYNSGPIHKQFFSVVKKICRLALPDSWLTKPAPEGDPVSEVPEVLEPVAVS